MYSGKKKKKERGIWQQRLLIISFTLIWPHMSLERHNICSSLDVVFFSCSSDANRLFITNHLTVCSSHNPSAYNRMNLVDSLKTYNLFAMSRYNPYNIRWLLICSIRSPSLCVSTIIALDYHRSTKASFCTAVMNGIFVWCHSTRTCCHMPSSTTLLSGSVGTAWTLMTMQYGVEPRKVFSQWYATCNIYQLVQTIMQVIGMRACAQYDSHLPWFRVCVKLPGVGLGSTIVGY